LRAKQYSGRDFDTTHTSKSTLHTLHPPLSIHDPRPDSLTLRHSDAGTGLCSGISKSETRAGPNREHLVGTQHTALPFPFLCRCSWAVCLAHFFEIDTRPVVFQSVP